MELAKSVIAAHRDRPLRPSADRLHGLQSLELVRQQALFRKNGISTMSRVHSFPPIASQTSKVLILGSMPGEASLKAGHYYAHPRNAFWTIMGELFGSDPSGPYEERVKHLQSTGVALWDSLQSCSRLGSMDASIANQMANDFPNFFDKHPNITHVFFNGSKAETAFRRYVLPSLSNASHKFARLPSTSPTHATMTLKEKVQAWSIVKKVLTGR